MFGWIVFTKIALAAGGSWGEYIPLLAKLFNLFLFVALLYLLLRRPIRDAFRARQQGIRSALMRAQEERDAALAKLEDMRKRLATLDDEVAALRAQAVGDAEAEAARIERSTEADLSKLRDQAQREVESAGKTARAELRAFAADQSVRLAEEMIRREMRPEDDARLVQAYVEELGGVGR